jgi:adenylate kinase
MLPRGTTTNVPKVGDTPYDVGVSARPTRYNVLRALLLAPPGAGKGTQGDRLAQIYKVPHIATGDLLRAYLAQSTSTGHGALETMERGELVPDDLVVALVLERIGDPELLSGFVLDGFPRTISQAQLAYEWALANDRTFQAVVSLDVPRDELVRRLLRRGQKGGRSDDTRETIAERLRVYSEHTAPLLDFYRSRGILMEIEGTGTIEEVTNRIRARLADVLD